MKKFLHLICAILVFCLLLVTPAQAAGVADSRASAFFAAYGTDLNKTSATSFEIWFDVTANGGAKDVLGVSEIYLYRSADQQSWSQIKMYSKDAYAGMVDYNTGSHTGYVTYNFATSGYYYRAYITFYAKNGTGTGERYVYTEILRM